MILVLFGCAPAVLPVTEVSAWQAAEEDPFGEGPLCDDWAVEDGLLEVDTGRCPWITLTQPLLGRIRAGDILAGGVVWQTLYADQPAEAVLGVAVDGEVVWDHTLAVPSEADDLRLSVEIVEDVAQGAPITLHVHNHGLNTYRWLGFNRERL